MRLWVLIWNSLLLGVGLAMDAFSVSLANGLHEPDMTGRRACLMAGTFGFFQALMPLIGWLCVRTVAQRFAAFQRWVPWIALILLLVTGLLTRPLAAVRGYLLNGMERFVKWILL